MKKLGLGVLLMASLHTAGFAFEVDYGQGKRVELQEEFGVNKERNYKVVWKDLIEPKLWVASEATSLEFDEKSCKQKQKYFAYKIENGQSAKEVQELYGQGTSDITLNFSISDFYLKSDVFRFALDKKGISVESVLKNDLILEVKEVEILYAPGSMGDLIGAEQTELFLKEKISKSAFALEEYGKIVLKSNHLALNCALLQDQVEAINFVLTLKQNPKITWIKKVSEQKVLGVSFRAQIESAMPSTNLLTPKKEGAVVNMMNYMLSLVKNNEEELLANKDLSYRLFTHITSSDSSKFLKLDQDSAMNISFLLADKKEVPVESQLTKSIQLMKESL